MKKQKEYILETEMHHLPVIKSARKEYPKYEAAFENIKQSLKGCISLIKEIHKNINV